jgi:hypothetical protein
VVPSDLASDGISAGAGTPYCQLLYNCYTLYGGQATIGTETVSFAPGQSAQVGPYRVTAGAMRANGPCDGPNSDAIAGFRTP